MIKYEYINPLKQYGKIEFDLIVTDDENPSFNYRIGKKFHDKITKEEMGIEALRTIELIKEGAF